LVLFHVDLDFGLFFLINDIHQPARIGLLTRAVTGILLKVIFFMMRDMGPGVEKN